jgi:poly(3-hydroxybutyrate) depolymerase
MAGDAPDGAVSTPNGGSGCGSTGAELARHNRTLDVNGVTREYTIEPPGESAGPVPIVLHFHGSGGTAVDGPDFWQVEEVSNRGAAFVYLQGLNGRWDVQNQGADVDFVKAIIEDVSEDYCVDTSRDFAFGFSFGAYQSNQLGCGLSDVLRAIAVVSGGGPNGGGCGDAIPALVIHGRNDPVVGFGSGESTRDYWHGANGCGDTTTPFDPAPCEQYEGCENPVVWCPHDGDHGVPAWTNQAIWNFFESFASES